MGLKLALKQSMFKPIQGRNLLLTYITIILITIINVDVSNWDSTEWVSLICATALPVIASLFNIETPSSLNLFKKVLDIIQQKDTSPEVKLRLIENEIIIAVNKWNEIVESIYKNSNNK